MRSLVTLARGVTYLDRRAVVHRLYTVPVPHGCQIRNISGRRARLRRPGSSLKNDEDQSGSAETKGMSIPSSNALDIYERLEHFLPLRLRRQQEAYKDSQADAEILYTKLPTFLRQFRQILPTGALSYLASQNDRLEALAFLAKQLIAIDVEATRGESPLNEILYQSPWLQKTDSSHSLDTISEEPFVFARESRLGPSTPKLQNIIDNEDFSKGHSRNTEYHEAIGELWAALGEIAIRASSQTEGVAQRLMQYAHSIFAQMHSKDLVPSDAYNFDDSNTPKAIRKSPYLHILSSRMMAAMSDASWSLPSSEHPPTQGLEESLFPPVVVETPSSAPHRLHPNVWLEFVLWICVRRGDYLEASRLLSAVYLAADDTRWKALTWDQVLALQKNSHKRQQSWFDRLMSIDEGYNTERPLVEMPAKTLSCEVIVAVISGLLALEDVEQIRSARRVSFYAYCQSLEDRDEVQALMLNSMVQQLGESLDLDAVVVSHLLDKQAQSAAAKNQRARRVPDPSSVTKESPSLSTAFAEFEPSIYVSYTIAAWESMILHGEVADALKLFETLRNATQVVSGPQLSTNQTRKRKGLAPYDLSSGTSTTVGPLPSLKGTPPQIPETALASFLQLLVRTNNLESARMLLYDESFGLGGNATSITFQPALLQAAVAVGDRELLNEVVQHLDIGFDALPDDVLYALYEAQVWLGIFKDTARLLQHMQKQRQLPLKPWLVIATACKFIASFRSKWTTDIEELRTILTEMLNGRFLPSRDPSRPFDYTESRTLSQLVRMLRSAHPSIEFLGLSNDVYLTSRTNTPIEISPDAFNPLLETVAEFQGVDAAREFFDIWCQPLAPPVLEENHEGMRVVLAPFEDEKVVTPTLETIQILLRSPLEDLQSWSQGGSRRRDPERYLLKWMDNKTKSGKIERPVATALPPNAPHREIFEWGAQTLRKMGYDDYAINNVIPGTFPSAK